MIKVAIIFCAPLVALFFITFIFQTYEVDGASMETTLSSKDRLIILKSSKSWAVMTGRHYIPQRYDIVVFDLKKGFSGNEGTQLIKRVIGLPGDRVMIRDGVVTVYNSEHPDGLAVDRGYLRAGAPLALQGVFTKVVEPDRVFVMGDNRANSLSSIDFGTIGSDDIVGTLLFRLYPFDKFGGV